MKEERRKAIIPIVFRRDDVKKRQYKICFLLFLGAMFWTHPDLKLTSTVFPQKSILIIYTRYSDNLLLFFTFKIVKQFSIFL